MPKFTRLGILMQPESPLPHTGARFNPGMALDGGTVHMLYRYTEWRDTFDPATQANYKVNEMRYARLSPEGRLLEDTGRAVLSPSVPWDVSGCEDARITPFEGWFYLVYAGWDKDAAPAGQDRARVGIARTRDFVTAEKLGFADHYTWDKDGFLFPERIGGKIALVHRVEPNIQIDYFDTFEQMLDPRTWAGYRERVEASTVLRAAYSWECGKVGGSVPPIKTDAGWLFIYHAVETFPDRPFIYRAGAALLDLRNPSVVTHRLPYPLMEPEEPYELIGDVNNVVFPVGGYVHEGELYISYGGADRVVALAKTNLTALVEELLAHPVP